MRLVYTKNYRRKFFIIISTTMDTSPSLQKHPVAIIGMSGLFAGAQNVDIFWENIVTQVNGITEVPSSRWQIADYYHPDPQQPDKTYSKVGGFLPDIDFDPLEYGLPPNILEVTDSSQILSLVMTKQVLQDARYDGERFSETVRRNTGVILGVGGGQKLSGSLNSRLQYPIWRQVLSQSGLSEEAIEEAIEKMKTAYVSWQENAFPGFLSNVIAGRIANRFDLGGTNCVVDAACAASLSAIKMAISELVEHRCDMMISGGVDTDNSPMAYLSFSKTPAFSKKNQIRPFDAEADGIVIGEGVGMLVMKRLADAERDQDTIYAVIRGIGSSSDGRHSSIYGPVSEGQQLAMQRAYQEAGYEPTTVGLVEAHGTGTPTGDRVEFHSIASVFQQSLQQTIALGSVKSQIGHTKTAAGAASMIKASLALHHKVLPPTINISRPNPAFNIETTPFYLNTQLRPWIPTQTETPRRASVSAFGFGGTNFHLTLEEYQAEHQEPYRRWSPFRTMVLHADTPAALTQRCQQVLHQIQHDPEALPPVPASIPASAPRVGWVYQDQNELVERLTSTQRLLQQSDLAKPWDHPTGISYRPQGIDADSKVAVLFSGQGAQYVDMGRELACLYPAFRKNFAQANRIMQELYHETLSDKVYPIPALDEATAQAQQQMLTRTQYAQPAIGVLSMSLYQQLTQAGLQPDMAGGHSFGELTALWATGVLSEKDYLTLACLRGRVMAQASQGKDAGGMLAVKADIETVRKIVRDESLNVDVSNVNAPNQVVLGGATADIKRAATVFSSHQLYAKVLPVSAAFHTARLREAQQPLAEAIGSTTFQHPQYLAFSNINGQPYPSTGSAVQQQFKEHMLSTVQFQHQIEAMYQAGARVFVEVGPCNILSNLVQSTLGDRTYHSIALNANPKQNSARLYQQALMQLLVIGVSLEAQDPYRVASPLSTLAKPKMRVQINASNYVSEKTRQQQEQAGQSANTLIKEIQSTKSNQPLSTMSPPSFPPDHAAPAATQPPLNGTHSELPQQIMRKQVELMEELFQLQVQQQEAVLEKYRTLLQTYQECMSQMLTPSPNGQKAVPSSPAPFQPTLSNLSEMPTPPTNGNGHDYSASKGHPLTAEAKPNLSSADAPAVPPPDQNETASIAEETVLAIIADKTGYPAEMLSLDMELVADLGIDSIKQVEIFGALREEYPVLQQWQTEDFVQIKTLGDIIAKSNQVLPPAQTPVTTASPVVNSSEKEPSTESASTELVLVVQTSQDEILEVPTQSSPAEATPEADAVANTLLTVIADKTGYPAEMLSPEMELVADLGIDSIKQVEIMGAMREQYPVLHEVDAEQLVALKTIQDVIDTIQQGTKKKKHGDSVNSVTPILSAQISPTAQAVSYQVPQQRIQLHPLPRPFQRVQEETDHPLVLLTHDGTEVTRQLAQALVQQGWRVVVLTWPGMESPAPENVTTLSLTQVNDEAIQDIMGQAQQQGTLRWLIHLHPPAPERADIVRAVFWLAKHLQPAFAQQPPGHSGFLAVVCLTGTFGYGATTPFDWTAAGLSGLVKSLNREWPTVFCRTVDLHPQLTSEQVVDRLLVEWQDTHVAIAEVGYDAHLNRVIPVTEPVTEMVSASSTETFQSSDVVVVTGGAQGITAECIIALAQTNPCTFLLLGRTDYQEEPAWAQGITEEKELKQAIFRAQQQSGQMPPPIKVQQEYRQIMASRSIKKTLEAIQQGGGNSTYLTVDITNAEAVQQALATVGTVTGIIHGAGALADKRIEKKTEADFDKVYNTKIQGLLNIMAAVDPATLKRLVLFSSIVGIYGNEGQADYALTNDTLNKWALAYQVKHPLTKVLAINWGPWITGMVTPYIQQEFEQRGVTLLSVDEGVAHFMQLLSSGTEGVVVVNAHFPAPKKRLLAPDQTLQIQQRVTRQANPFLEHHVIGSYPVMPFVTGLAWIANVAEQLHPGYRLVQSQNSKLFNGIIFNGKQAEDYHLDLQVTQQDAEAIRLTGKVWSLDEQSRRRYHYGSEVLLATSPSDSPTRELPTFGDTPLKTREALYREGSLFHGPLYQGIEALWHMDEQTLWYTCRLPEPNAQTQGQFPLQTSKTFTTDAMCQGFLVWAYHHPQTSCLPAGMGTMHIYEPLPFDETFWVHLRITEHQGHKIVGDATAINTQGKVLVTTENITLTANRELLSLYAPTELLAVVDMDICLPGVRNLDAFHRMVYDGTLNEEATEPIEQYDLLRRAVANRHSPQMVVMVGEVTTVAQEPWLGESLSAATLPEALATTRRWLQQHPEDSVLLVASSSSGSEAVVRLASEAYRAQESVYAVLGEMQPLNSSTLEVLLPTLSYWEVAPAASPLPNTGPTATDAAAPTCALGTLSLAEGALQDVARLIKIVLSLHYRFIPTLPASSDLPLAEWDARHFYAPEYSFPWIPENTAEQRVAALSFTDEMMILPMQEAYPPAPKAMTYLRQQDQKLLLVSGNGQSELQDALTALSHDADAFSYQWAAERYHQHQAQPGQYTVSLIIDSSEKLVQEIANAQKGVAAAFAGQKTWQTPVGSYFTAEPLGEAAKIGFVYPGLASSYGGMAHDYLQLFPQYLDYYSAKIDQLHELVHHPLVHPRYLERPDLSARRAREAHFLNYTVASAESSISMSVLMTHVLQKEFGLQPEAALGYSMGGITMLFATEVWGFQHLHSRVQQSPIFQPNPAYEHWAHWVLNAPAEQVQQQLTRAKNLYLTFTNTPNNVIISGERAEGETWLQRHRYEAMMVDLHNVAHCPPVEAMYETLREMHRLEIEQTPTVRCYSGVTRKVLPLDTEVLAQNAADTYCQPVDFVALVRQAYQDGINMFVEVGPKAWCSRLIEEILQPHPHVALSIDQKGVSNYRSLLKLSSVLGSHGVPMRLPYYDLTTAPLVSDLAKETVPQPSVATPARILEMATLLQERESVLQTLDQACYLYRQEDDYYLSPCSVPDSSYEAVGLLPAHPAEQLGSAAFRAAYGVKFAYMAGAMANGIASEEMVIALGQQRLLGSFGAAGLRPERVEQAIHKIQEALPQGPYAFNLIHTPGDEALEMKLVTMYLECQMRTLEASAFMEVTLALVYYRAAGLAQDADGNVVAQNKIIAKVSRAEVARPFMQPAPDPLLDILVRQGKITSQQQAWARALPMADDITVEADSGGHTDRQPLVCALPEMIRLRERVQQQYSYPTPPRIGAAGGISTPASVVAALALGADYVVTGSINQTCQEAGTSLKVKELLAQASSADVGLAPSADMFEMGVSVQVLKRGTLYANRAKKLYQLYQQYDSLADIPAPEREKLEKQLFQKSVAEVWEDTEAFFQRHDLHKLAAARQHPKKKMALVFRWYLGLSSKWAVEGIPGRTMDYQVWCGPAMGAFNDWVKGSPMEALEHRDVAGVALRLLREAALQQRIQLLEMYGVANAGRFLTCSTEVETLAHA